MKEFIINQEKVSSIIRTLNSGNMKERIEAAVILHNLQENPCKTCARRVSPPKDKAVYWFTCGICKYQPNKWPTQYLPAILGES